MPKIYFLQGLPASGKSTWSKEQVAKNPHGTVRVNKDDLRAMCHNSVWGKDNEKLILDIRDSIIWEALDKHRNVIVDDTNFNPVHLENVRKIAKDKNAEVIVKFFDVSLDECIARDVQRGANRVGEKVIREMYEKYLAPKEVDITPPQDRTLPKAVIVDIDGTVAKMNGRGPHEYHRVSEDLAQEDIIDLVEMFHNEGFKIIFLSGRKPSCRDDTLVWLRDHFWSIEFEALYLREDEDDNRKDYIFKKEAYDRYIKGKYYVKYAIDDRDQVVKLWRNLGLRCLQVAEGAF